MFGVSGRGVGYGLVFVTDDAVLGVVEPVL